MQLSAVPNCKSKASDITVFENRPKCRIFKNSPKWTIFGIFNEILAAQNVNVARFARNVEWDFFCDFQTLCKGRCSYPKKIFGITSIVWGFLSDMTSNLKQRLPSIFEVTDLIYDTCKWVLTKWSKIIQFYIVSQ